MADRQVPGILVILLALLTIAGGALVVLWTSVFDIASLAVLLGVVAYFLVVHVYLPYRVYEDARHSGSSAAAGWTAVAFFLPLLGVAIYFVVSRTIGE